MYTRNVMVCAGTGCTSSKSLAIAQAFEEDVKSRGLEDQIEIVRTGCFGLCALGPIVIVYPEGSFYSQIDLSDVKKIVEQHLVGGTPVKRLLYQETVHPDGSIIALEETDFYRKQLRLALRNCGVIDPENIREYIGRNGYSALAKVLLQMKPEEVIQTITDSGLRGRGGAGFPCGKKLWFVSQYEADQKYVLCNADEGDPGAFMDRSILEGDPHVVLEAMAIAGYGIGATKGIIYVRAEYPIAVGRLEIAIQQAREIGLLGENLFGSAFSFDVELKLGAGAFVCGEGTALVSSVSGRRGEPNTRPPRLAEKGIFGKPTALNNVETLANIPQIILNGADWFSSIGTAKSSGTKVFALGGKIKNTGLVEVPMGTTLREIVDEIGGGVPDNHQFKAVQTGGPSGGCIPASHFDLEMDFDNLTAIGSMMGSGGLIVMDDTTCMVDIAKFFLEFTVDESCGKCTPCRVGTKRLLELLNKVTDGRATMDDLDRIKELCTYISENSLCGLGESAANPVLSTLQFFEQEYIDHIQNKHCSAGVCKSLLTYSIDHDKCIGCSLCARNCPTNAISGEVKHPFTIDASKCIKCGVCLEKCKFDAVVRS